MPFPQLFLSYLYNFLASTSVVNINTFYRLYCVPSKFMCWRPNTQSLRLWLYLERVPLKGWVAESRLEVIMLGPPQIWLLYEERQFRHRDIKNVQERRKNYVKKQQEYVHLQAKETGVRRWYLCWQLHVGIPASRLWEISFSCLRDLVWGLWLWELQQITQRRPSDQHPGSQPVFFPTCPPSSFGFSILYFFLILIVLNSTLMFSTMQISRFLCHPIAITDKHFRHCLVIQDERNHTRMVKPACVCNEM